MVPETRELGQLVRMLEERGADTVPCPMVAIRDTPDTAPVETWLHRFAKGTCDDLVLMTGEGLLRLLGFAQRIDLERPFLLALAATRKITRGPKPVRALRKIGLGADLPADEPTTEGVIAALERLDLTGRRVGVQLYPGRPPQRRCIRSLVGAPLLDRKARATSRNRRTWNALVKAIASIWPAAISAMTAITRSSSTGHVQAPSQASDLAEIHFRLQ